MAAAIPVHSSKKGKPDNESTVQSTEVQVSGTAGTPEVSPEAPLVSEPQPLELDLGYKLESHQAYRKDN